MPELRADRSGPKRVAPQLSETTFGRTLSCFRKMSRSPRCRRIRLVVFNTYPGIGESAAAQHEAQPPNAPARSSASSRLWTLMLPVAGEAEGTRPA